MQYNDIIHKLQKLSNPEAVAGMARYGIKSKNAYGISILDLRSIAKEVGTDPQAGPRAMELKHTRGAHTRGHDRRPGYDQRGRSMYGSRTSIRETFAISAV